MRHNTIPYRLTCALVAVLSVAGGCKPTQTAVDPHVGEQIAELNFAGIPLLQKSNDDRTVTVHLILMGGLRGQQPGTEGVEALALEAVAHGGSGDRSAADIDAELARLGTQIDTRAGAEFSYVAMRCLEPAFEASWALLTARLLQPAWAPDDVLRARQRVLARQDELLGARIQRLRLQAVHALAPESVYGRLPEGSPETVQRIRPEEIQAHYGKLMRLDRIRLVVVGGIAPLRLQREIIGTLSNLPRGDGSTVDALVPVAPFDSLPPAVLVPTDDPATELVGLMPAPPPGTREAVALETALAMLSDRLAEDLCIRRSVACDAFTAYAPGQQAYALAGVRTERPVAAARALTAAARQAAALGFRQEELEAKRQALLTRYYSGLQGSTGQAALLSEGFARPQADWRVMLALPPLLESLTLAEVNAVANRYLTQWHWVALGQVDGLTPAVFRVP